ncbi:Clavaminate synthase-like protein [Basidiobolus meristosporus CBS 931.73]|uniref:Clavaminate synthase-like protein n=1 Tax=Basidiobolus meristosporus CBS 931.73 TaxID=1314790 RepID=A0A1Y1YID1_9FUNG|nr:Clavaminate synthase-like protein [Basidiobolus meristosporus CBS 931.73]|eukprot:ORX97698.1 Clavaminate synthase-like protein [Basidiobolus meristosporus CBS 931.73]
MSRRVISALPRVRAYTSLSGPSISPASAIKRIEAPSLADFKKLILPNGPVILEGATDHWPAREKWTDLEFWKSKHGDVVVPIETGIYTDANFEQRHMRLKEFIETYIENKHEGPAGRIGYLAQCQLFEKIPSLQQDFQPPEYSRAGRNDIYPTNGWFGPKGTISPIHRDPYCNLFAQVVGRKYLRIYPVSEQDKLYPYNNPFQKNTSRITHLDNVDPLKYPKFQSAKYEECILTPGDLLYIPKGYWHYVESLDTSISISFWWL